MVPVAMKLKKDIANRYKRFAVKKGINYQTFVSKVPDAHAKQL
jgi:predicted DNA binding CopG/RHH family protein